MCGCFFVAKYIIRGRILYRALGIGRSVIYEHVDLYIDTFESERELNKKYGRAGLYLI